MPWHSEREQTYPNQEKKVRKNIRSGGKKREIVWLCTRKIRLNNEPSTWNWVEIYFRKDHLLSQIHTVHVHHVNRNFKVLFLL